MARPQNIPRFINSRVHSGSEMLQWTKQPLGRREAQGVLAQSFLSSALTPLPDLRTHREAQRTGTCSFMYHHKRPCDTTQAKK